MIDEKYYKYNEEEMILKDLGFNGIFINSNFSIEKFPGARIMEYSQFNRIHMSKKYITANDVMIPKSKDYSINNKKG